MPDMQKWITCAAAAMVCATTLPTLAADPPPKSGMAAVLESAPASDWRKLDPAHTLYMDLPEGRVVIELAPFFAPNHVANIKTLVQGKYFDGLAILRSQDNYVVQWGDPNEKEPKSLGKAKSGLKGEFTVAVKKDFPFTPLPDRDGYAPQSGFSGGFPAGYDPREGKAWLTHCYGMVGVGRDNSADSGDGSGLYVVTGHAPRHLDRNITVVGRVVQGMSLLSTIRRGAPPMGFFTGPEQYVAIRQVQLAADLPEQERVNLEVLKTDSASFKKAIEALRNRKNDWFKVQANYLELCNVPLMVRPVKQGG